MKDLNFQSFDKDMQIALQIIKETIEVNEALISTLQIIQATKATISRGTGAPSGGNDKDLYIDDSTDRLYININGTWKYTALT